MSDVVKFEMEATIPVGFTPGQVIDEIVTLMELSDEAAERGGPDFLQASIIEMRDDPYLVPGRMVPSSKAVIGKPFFWQSLESTVHAVWYAKGQRLACWNDEVTGELCYQDMDDRPEPGMKYFEGSNLGIQVHATPEIAQVLGAQLAERQA